ncbi:MAG: hypothetical protein ACM3XM_16920, partial [Mycobacterium leprae]
TADFTAPGLVLPVDVVSNNGAIDPGDQIIITFDALIPNPPANLSDTSFVVDDGSGGLHHLGTDAQFAWSVDNGHSVLTITLGTAEHGMNLADQDLISFGNSVPAGKPINGLDLYLVAESQDF